MQNHVFYQTNFSFKLKHLTSRLLDKCLIVILDCVVSAFHSPNIWRCTSSSAGVQDKLSRFGGKTKHKHSVIISNIQLSDNKVQMPINLLLVEQQNATSHNCCEMKEILIFIVHRTTESSSILSKFITSLNDEPLKCVGSQFDSFMAPDFEDIVVFFFEKVTELFQTP